jgi:hypothetical protein
MSIVLVWSNAPDVSQHNRVWHNIFLMQWRMWKNTTKQFHTTQSDTAKKINSHSLGTDYNKLGNETVNLWNPQ